MSNSASLRLGALGKLVTTIVVAGVLVAALLFPWVGGTGLVARNSASLLDALPVELTDETPNGNTTVLAADGSVITQFYVNNRTPVTPDEIAPVMKQAIVDIEDSRFYEHNGLDVQGTLRALATNLAAGSVQEGGSTLTQQLVKQTLLQTAETDEERRAATSRRPAASCARPDSPSPWSRPTPRTRSSPATSTSPTSAPAPTGSRRPRRPTSASTPRT